MGLFDRVLGKDKAETGLALTRGEAFTAVAVAAIASDGTVNDEEIARTAMNLASLPVFRNYQIKEMADILNRVSGIIKRRGVAAVLPAAKETLTKEQAEQALFLAADLTLADGIVEKDERLFLDELRVYLGVDEVTALKIVEVVVIKNRAA